MADKPSSPTPTQKSHLLTALVKYEETLERQAKGHHPTDVRLYYLKAQREVRDLAQIIESLWP